MELGLELEEEPTYWRLAVSGELGVGECSRFRLNVDRVLRYRPDLAIVDMSDLEYLDSSGLGILLSLSKQYSAGEGQLVLVTSEPVHRLLSVAGLNGAFTTASSLREALESHGLDAAVSARSVQREARTRKGEFGTGERATQM